MGKRRVGRPRKKKRVVKKKKGRRRLQVKILDGRKRIQIGGKKYKLTAVGKKSKKGSRKRRTPPRDSKGRFRKRR